jgi:RNA polymerase sigma-70 factor (ECF subfamily)
MDRYAEGDDAAFAKLYDAVAPRLHSYLRKKVRSDAVAEDVLQQTFLHVHRARGNFIPGSPVLPWAFAIARRLLLDELRRDYRNVLTMADDALDAITTDPDEGGDRIAEANELARALERELTRLPKSQRAAFQLMRIDGLSHVEAAAALGATVSAVKLRAHRAYGSLRRAIEQLMTEPVDSPVKTR